jgi:hypothetical protein
MSDVFYEFFQTPEQLRRIGARGGRATARHRRQRLEVLTLAATARPTPYASVECQETVAEAIALLDAQFPWLQGAESRGARS